jgi:hypothetical protein
MSDVRGDPTTIDAPWMTAALEEAGVARGATVTGCELAGFIGTGQMSRNARFRLVWDDPAGRPATVVGKFPSSDPTARASGFNGAYRNEWTFYTQLEPTVRVRAPRCYVARYDEAAPDFVILMEDLAGSRQGDQFEGLSVDQVSLALEQAVGLHAPRWGDRTLEALFPQRVSDEEGAAQMHAMFPMLVDHLLNRLGDRIDADIVELLRAFTPRAANWLMGPDSPRTAVHRDFRADNFLFATEAGAPPIVVVDWQTLHPSGNALWDVAYLIGGSFAPPDRARVERGLVDEYRDRLGAAGVALDADTCWRDYRLGSLWLLVMGVIAHTMAEQTDRGDDLFVLFVQHGGRHALDLEALSLVP